MPGSSSGTVLATELSGYVAIAEPLPPDQAAAVLDGYYRRFALAAEANEATLVTFRGPTALAAWDPSLGLEYGAMSAAQTARLLITSQQPVQDGFIASLLRGIRFGIGIATGLLFIGPLGPDPARTEMVGDTVNTAIMLAAQAAASEVLITGETRLALGDRARSEQAELLSLSGKRTRVDTHRMLVADS